MALRPWSQDDAPWLRTSLRQFVEANLARGGDFLPTERNIETLLTLGLEGAQAGYPCYIATRDAMPIAFVLWCPAPGAETLDCRWKTIVAYASFTAPEARGNGVAGALRQGALARTKALGFTRIMGPVALSNEKGMQEFVRQGAWPTHAQWEILL